MTKKKKKFPDLHRVDRFQIVEFNIYQTVVTNISKTETKTYNGIRADLV
jgi:hypothetical protein